MIDPHVVTERHRDSGFFDRTRTTELIQLLGKQRKITIFAGAGVSIDRGTPDWRTLIKSLLQERLPDLSPGHGSPMSPATAAQTAALLLEWGAPLPAASMVKQLYLMQFGESDAADTQLQNRLAYLLYEEWQPRTSLASFIAMLALFYKTRGADVHVITPNYDDNIETTKTCDPHLAEVQEREGIEFLPSRWTPPRQPGLNIPVVHIHGLLTRKGLTMEPLILSEEDYSRWSVDHECEMDRLRRYVMQRFARTSVLFVGTSLRDPNIVDALALTKRTAHAQRLALLPMIEEDKFCEGDGLEPTFGFTAGANLRTANLGVEAIRPDYYGQVAQFLNEVALCVSDPDRYAAETYMYRLDAWCKKWAIHVKKIGPVELRAAHNRRLRLALDRMNLALSVPDANRAKIELWVRQEPRSRELTRFSTSNAIHTGSEEAPLRRLSICGKHRDFEVVEAFISRRAVSGAVSSLEMKDRWSHYMALPVVLQNEPWSGLPVGVVALIVGARDVEDAQFPVSRSGRDKLLDELGRVGRELLG
jgi:hypothetical protein